MDSFRLFLDGIAVGFVIALTIGFILYRVKQARDRRPKNEVDQFIDEFQEYYRGLEEEKADPYDERGM